MVEVFYKLEKCLEKTKINNDQIIVSQQYRSDAGVRNYRSFHTLQNLLEYFEKPDLIKRDLENQFMYEVLPENLPRYLYFDIESTTDLYHHSIDEILDHLINSIYNTIIQFTDRILPPELDIQIASACKDNKISYHIKFTDIIFETVNDIKQFINVFKTVIKDDPFYHSDDQDSIIDFVPYGINQNFRMLYQSKNGSDRVLLPILDSSLSLLDHLVGYYGKDRPTFTTVILEPEVSWEETPPPNGKGREHGETLVAPQELETISEKETIDITDLNDPRQLLSCIPNHKQSWATWITIGMCLHQLGDQYRQDWIDWSNLSHKGTTQASIRQWTTFNRNKAHVVGLTRLRNIALQYQPHNRQLFDDNHSVISDFVDLQSDGINEETYNQQYVKPYPFSQKINTIIEQSQMGTGKTYQAKQTIKNLLQVNPKARILFMSARVTFAVSMTSEINRDINTDFKIYKKVKGDLCLVPRLMIQMESLHKLDGAKPYDLVILDESESCLKQFSSTTMKQLAEVTKVFQNIISKCQWLLVCDAFISNRSLVLTELRNRDKCLLRKNLYVSKPRQVVMIKKKNLLVNTLISKLSQGYKCFFVSASKKLIKEIEDEFKDKYRILSYHADKDDKHNVTLENVTKTWSEYDLVICSATITIGINFDINYFDYCFLYGSSYGATPRDLLQSHMRVRFLKESTIYCHIYHSCCPVKRSEHRLKDIMERGEIVAKFNLPFAIYKQEAPLWLKKIMFLSELEDSLSGQLVLQLYKYYFKILGYTFAEPEDSIQETDKDVEINDNERFIEYDQIDDINRDEYEEINKAVQYGESTYLDRCKLHKYLYKNHIHGGPLHEQIFFDRYFADPINRQKFFKIVKEIKAMEKPNLLNEKDISYADLQISTNLLTSLVTNVVQNLGLNHSQDLETQIQEELIKVLPKKIPELDQKVKMLIPSSHKIEDQSNDPLRLVNRILTQHGFTICRKKRNRQRVRGKLVDLEPYYQLESLNPTFNDEYSPQELAHSLMSNPLPKGKSLL